MIFLKSNISYAYRKRLLLELQGYKKDKGLSMDEWELLKDKNEDAIASVINKLKVDASLGHHSSRFKKIFGGDLDTRGIKNELSYLKEFESFENKINFEKFTPFFDFRRLLYQNNPQLVENIYFKNKKVIPTYLSTIFTELFFKGVISNISRLHVENYFLSVMRNMDYKNFFSIQNLPKEAFDKKLPSFTLIQSSFHKAIGPYMETLYGYRFSTLTDKKSSLLSELGIDSVPETTYFFEPLRDAFSNDQNHECAKAIFSLHKNNTYQGRNAHLHNVDSKTTAANVKQYFNEIRDRGANLESKWFKENGYNIVLITNTFCIPKLCYEVEKYLFRDPSFPKPANILVFGNETFYQLYSHEEFTKKRENTPPFNFPDDTEPLKKLRVQAFMYEMFMHALDRNNHNS